MFELGSGFEEDLYDTGSAAGGAIGGADSDEEDDFAPREYSYKSYVTTQHLLLDEAEKVIAGLEKNLYKAQYGQTEDSSSGSGSGSSWNVNSNSAGTGMWEAEDSLHDHSVLRMMEDDTTPTSASGSVLNTVLSPMANIQNTQDTQDTGGSGTGTSRDNLITLALSRINIHCAPGEVVAIVGQVGCGKTSILRALLGDMKLLYGDAVIKGTCAYVSQKPFIQVGSVY